MEKTVCKIHNAYNKNSNHNNDSIIINNNNNKNDTIRIGFKKHYTGVNHLFLTSRNSIDKHQTFSSLRQIRSVKMGDL